MGHEWDEDACCVHCGFDGAEWWHWRHRTYEGRAAIGDEARMPPCEPRMRAWTLFQENAKVK